MHTSSIRFLAAVVLGMALVIPVGLLFGSDPAVTPRVKDSFRAVVEDFKGGDLNGYGAASAISVSSTTGTFYTTAVSSDGVYRIDFLNTGSYNVLISTNGTSVSTSNCNELVPAGASKVYKSKRPVTTVYYYTPATGTSTTLYASY